MMDFEKARTDALKYLKLTSNVKVLDRSEIAKLTFKGCSNVWQVNTEIFLPDDTIKGITILIALPDDFPLTLPKLFLSAEDYNLVKYIPHVNTEMNICLYDDEYVTVDPNRPGQILKESIIKARKIIEAGLKGENEADFQDEFIAYWQDKYCAQDIIVPGLCLLGTGKKLGEETIQIHILLKTFQGYNYVLMHSDDDMASVFMRSLEDRGITSEVAKPFYMGIIAGLKPPFAYTNQSLYDLISNSFPELVEPYQSFLNNSSPKKFVVFGVQISHQIAYFAWEISKITTSRRGFRPGSLSQFQVYRTFLKGSPVKRFHFEAVTRQRLIERTEGPYGEERPLELVIAGLGSIGSNLLQYLFSPRIKTLTLVDPDLLKLENVNRHLLGFSYLNYPKVSGLKSYFKDKNPYLQVNAFQRSIIHIVNSKLEILNESDYIFIVIGKSNLERYIIQALADGQIKKPVFVLWVEPFLCGGHCLHLNPGHTYKFDDDYDEGLYKYNIIDSSEYHEPANRLLFREAGCQSSFVPYGQQNIALFISSLLPYITRCFEKQEKDDFRLTWKGNQEAAEKFKLKFSSVGNSMDFGNLQYTKL